MNIRFCYMYRDAGNYKQFGSVIFSNPSGLSIDKSTDAIKKKLIDDQFFYPEKWNIPLIYAYTFDPELDHQWFEFKNIEFTLEEPTDKRSFDMFLKGL